MTGKERMLKTLRFEEPDRPPHFEIMFELEEEAFGLSFPEQSEWDNCSRKKKDKLIGRCMDIYEKIVSTYNWDALAVFYPWSDPDGVRAAQKTFGDDILIGSIVGHSVWSIEYIENWSQFSMDLFDRPDHIHEVAENLTETAIAKIDRLVEAGAEFVHLVNDVAFNGGPFIAPERFHTFVTPYLRRQVAHIRERGAIPFIHSDGDVKPLLDDFLSLNAACFQSVDPMAGMDIATVKKECEGQMALMGNVQCDLLQEGPREAIRDSALYCLKHASPGGGYVFSTSNTVFPGMPLSNYEYMLSVYHDFCQEKGAAK